MTFATDDSAGAAMEAKRILRREHKEMCDAVRVWLRFDNEVEVPKEDAPEAQHLAYESAKWAITERVAKALDGQL